MSLPELIILSVCSSRSLAMIHQVGWKEIKKIEFRSTEDSSQFWIVDEHSCDRQDDHYEQQLLQIDPISYKGSDWLHYDTLNISGVDLFYVFPYAAAWRKKSLIVYTDSQQFPELIRAHLSSLFGSHLHFSVHSYGVRVIQILPLSNIKESFIYARMSALIESQQLDDYFKKSPDQEVVSLFGPVTSVLDVNSFFFNTQHLRIRTNNLLFNQVLINFKGKTLASSDTVVSDESIVEFLRKWISTDSFHNLEVVWIKMRKNYRLSPSRIMQNFFIRKFDQSRPPPEIHSTAKGISAYRIEQYCIELASPIYIVRDIDGAVASLEIKENSFILAVWNLNEKQFIDGSCY